MIFRTRILVKCSIVLTFLGAFLAVALFGTRPEVDASASGPSASHTNAPGEDNCTACHTSYAVNSGDGSVAITGVPHEYLPGQQYQITVKTSQDFAVDYGFQITAVDSNGHPAGNFGVPDDPMPKMQTIVGLVGSDVRQYVEHTVDGLFTNGVFGSNSWTFTWTAPSSRIGRIGFHAAGNAADGSGDPLGDYIYTTSALSFDGPLSISGRATYSGGAGIPGVRIIISNPQGAVRTAITNSFGYFTIDSIPGGTTYTVAATAKRLTFASQQVDVSANLTNVNFTPQ
jgi:hypothetical protein